MIKYALNCAGGCRFEAWFQNSAACDAQIADGRVSCPICGRSEVSKALMAPNIGAVRDAEPSQEAQKEPVDAPPPPAEAPAPPSPEARRRMVEERLRALRSLIEATAENVGDGFAAEARRIQEGEAEARAIYGDATQEQIEDLIEDDIPVARLPWINRRDD